MKNYYLVSMNYMNYDFVKLKVEYDENETITWQVPETRANMIKCGDVVYFYVFNIASQSKDKKARILLRGEVNKEPQLMKYEKIYRSSVESEEKAESKDILIGVSIGKLTTLKKEELENDSRYSWKELNANYRLATPPRGKSWFSGNLEKDSNNSLKAELIEVLEESFKKYMQKDDFTTLINHFNRECFFCGKKGVKNDHKTFKRRNGTDYFEGHHFIPQHTSESKKLQKIIDSNENLVWLCPNCHNQLHYGRPDDVNTMIALFWKDENIKNLLTENDFQAKIGVDNETEALNWIKDVYKSIKDKK